MGRWIETGYLKGLYWRLYNVHNDKRDSAHTWHPGLGLMGGLGLVCHVCQGSFCARKLIPKYVQICWIVRRHMTKWINAFHVRKSLYWEIRRICTGTGDKCGRKVRRHVGGMHGTASESQYILPIILQCITWTILFKSIIVVLPYCRRTYEVLFHWPHGQIIMLWVPQSLCAQNSAENHTTNSPKPL